MSQTFSSYFLMNSTEQLDQLMMRKYLYPEKRPTVFRPLFTVLRKNNNNINNNNNNKTLAFRFAGAFTCLEARETKVELSGRSQCLSNWVVANLWAIRPLFGLISRTSACPFWKNWCQQVYFLKSGPSRWCDPLGEGLQQLCSLLQSHRQLQWSFHQPLFPTESSDSTPHDTPTWASAPDWARNSDLESTFMVHHRGSRCSALWAWQRSQWRDSHLQTAEEQAVALTSRARKHPFEERQHGWRTSCGGETDVLNCIIFFLCAEKTKQNFSFDMLIGQAVIFTADAHPCRYHWLKSDVLTLKPPRR